MQVWGARFNAWMQRNLCTRSRHRLGREIAVRITGKRESRINIESPGNYHRAE